MTIKPNEIIRIALIDDHLYLWIGLASMLEKQSDMEVVAEAGTAEEGIARCRETNPDIALMDLRLPDGDGIKFTAALRHAAPDTRVIVLTTFDNDKNMYGAIQAGAHAFLLKDVPKADLLATIRTVHSGVYQLPATVAKRVAERLREEPLSDREIEIVRCIAAGQSNKEISAQLFISESTVKGQINRILAKLHARDRTEAVVAALKRGLIHIE